jgi:hypothetical protein
MFTVDCVLLVSQMVGILDDVCSIVAEALHRVQVEVGMDAIVRNPNP